MGSELGAWQPVSPDALPEILAGVSSPWWLAGGWALDAHLGRQSREHEDTDVLILRRDHVAVRAALADWDAHAADPPGTLRPWPVGETLPETVHDVWLRASPHDDWAFQLMIDDAEGEDWVFRRDLRVRRPLADLSGPASNALRQVLAPEIQLLYKSRGLRPKDQQDFDALRPVLDAEQTAWLRTSLELTSPGHPWLGSMPAATSPNR